MRRRFSPLVYVEIITRQSGICACGCKDSLGTDPRDIEYDHFMPIHLGGRDHPDNLRALKKRHHLTKTVAEAKARAKAARIRAREGLTKKRLSQRDKATMKLLERWA